MYRFFARNGLPLPPVVRPPVHTLPEALAQHSSGTVP